jgi:hypothetical protein
MVSIIKKTMKAFFILILLVFFASNSSAVTFDEIVIFGDIDLKKKILENDPFLRFDKKRWTFV